MTVDSNKQAKYGAIISYVSIIFYIISGFLYTPFLIKKLGMSDYGLFTISLSVIAYFSMDFGIGVALTRFIARFIAEGKDDCVKDLLGLTIKLYIVIDLIIAISLVIVYFFSNSIFANLTPNELERFRVVLLITSSFVVLSFPLLPINGIFLAYERIIAVQTIELAAKILQVSLIIIAIFCGLGLFAVVLVSSCVTIMAQVCKLYYLRNKVGLSFNIKYYNKKLLKAIGSFSLWATVASIADKFFFPAIPFILAIVSNTHEIAIFAIVASIEGYVLTIARAMNGIFMPRVMKHVVAQSDGEIVTDLMIKVGRIQLYIIGIIIINLVAFGREFICLWVGENFLDSYLPTIIVLIPCVFHFTMNIAEEMILARNMVSFRALVYAFGSVINVLFAYFLSERHGALGAGVSISLSYILSYNILASIIYKKKLGLNIWRFLKECQIKILPILISVLIVAMCVNEILIQEDSLCLFIIKICAISIVTIFMLWIFCFNNEEKALFKSIIRKN